MDKAQGVKKTGTSWSERPGAVPCLLLGSGVPGYIRKAGQSQASTGSLTLPSDDTFYWSWRACSFP